MKGEMNSPQATNEQVQAKSGSGMTRHSRGVAGHETETIPLSGVVGSDEVDRRGLGEYKGIFA